MDKKFYKNLLKCILIIFLFFETTKIQKLLVIIFNIKKINITTAAILNLSSNIIFLIFILLVYRKELKKEWLIFKKDISNNLDCGIKYWLIGLVAMAISNIIIGILLGGGQANNEQMVHKMIKALPIFMVINAGIIGPINEELIFRKGFKNVFTDKWKFILISGIFFGLCHVTSATTLQQFLYFIPYSSLGIAFATMYYKTKTIYTSMFIHITHNVILTLVSVLSLI